MTNISTNGVSEKPLIQEGTPQLASTGLRGLAFILDVIIGILGALLFIPLLGFLIPIDSKLILLTIPITALAAMTYLIASPCLFGNSLGKYVFGMLIQGTETMQKPGIKQCVLRGILLGIWPVEAIIMSISKTRQRFGDTLAKTRVVKNPHTRHHGIVRAVIAVMVGVLLFMAGWYANGYAIKRTNFYRAAVEYIEAQKPGEMEFGSPLRLGAVPRHVSLLYPISGKIVIPTMWPKKSAFLVITLVNQEGKWVGQKSQIQDQGGPLGYSYRYSAHMSSLTNRGLTMRQKTLQHPAFQAALAHIKADKELFSQIGTVTNVNFVSGKTSEDSTGKESADYTLTVTGEQGSVTVILKLSKEKETPWNVTALTKQE